VDIGVRLVNVGGPTQRRRYASGKVQDSQAKSPFAAAVGNAVLTTRPNVRTNY